MAKRLTRTDCPRCGEKCFYPNQWPQKWREIARSHDNLLVRCQHCNGTLGVLLTYRWRNLSNGTQTMETDGDPYLKKIEYPSASQLEIESSQLLALRPKIEKILPTVEEIICVTAALMTPTDAERAASFIFRLTIVGVFISDAIDSSRTYSESLRKQNITKMQIEEMKEFWKIFNHTRSFYNQYQLFTGLNHRNTLNWTPLDHNYRPSVALTTTAENVLVHIHAPTL